MVRVLHVIQLMSRGGAARAMCALARYARQTGEFEHSILSLKEPDEGGLELAKSYGMTVHHPQSMEEAYALCAQADIVELEWWNNPELDAFLRGPLPPMRLSAWCHVAGNRSPQIIPRELLNLTDLLVACSPFTYDNEVIQRLDPETRLRRTAMVYGAADFARLKGLTLQPHTGFNVGYIGTVHPLKMHPDFIALSAAVRVPGVKFVVCGDGKVEDLVNEAQRTADPGRFDFRGYVDDIRPVIAELDVYGYPLCEDTYAAAELNLQEVMYCGVPPVVFPHGGIRHLVFNNFTGLVVKSAQEYSDAIEYLFHNPEERMRMGQNAQSYSQQIFGAENAAKDMIKLYRRLMAEVPKRSRVWGKDVERSLLESPITPEDLLPSARHTSGSDALIAILGSAGEDFRRSRLGGHLDEILTVDQRIGNSTDVLKMGGIYLFESSYSDDPYLRLWGALASLGSNDVYSAIIRLLDALRMGLREPRVVRYLQKTLEAVGPNELTDLVYQQLHLLAPEFMQPENSAHA